MNQYIKDLTNLIEFGQVDNTYKMSWIRSIVEICQLEEKENYFL